MRKSIIRLSRFKKNNRENPLFIFSGKKDNLIILLDKNSSLPTKIPTSSNFSLKNTGQDENVFFTPQNSESDNWIPLMQLKELPLGQGQLLCKIVNTLALNDFPLPNIFKINYTTTITFFGGSFNPWHAGHRACLDLCPENNIVVVPDHNPFKKSMDGCPWQLICHLADQLKNTNYKIYPALFGAEGKSYTYQWIKNISSKKKGLIIGDDNFLIIQQWFKYELLLKELSTLYVVPRTAVNNTVEKKRETLRHKFKNLNIDILPKHPFQEVSSTELRKKR